MCELSEVNGHEQNSRILPKPHENIPYARNYARTVESWMRPSSILKRVWILGKIDKWYLVMSKKKKEFRINFPT